MDSIKLIERYFEQSLSETELKDFQRRLEIDEEFAQAFLLEKDVMEGIEVLGNLNLKKDLKKIYKEEIEEKRTTQSKVIPRRMWLVAAASIAILFVALWFFTRPPTPGQLYATYFQPEFDFVEKGNENELIVEAEMALKDGAYQRAIPILDQLLDLNPQNTEYLLAKGIALIESEKFTEGINLLTMVGKNSPYAKPETQWYHGLALLKQGLLKESHLILKQIPAQSSRYKQAEELAKKIKR